VSSRDWNRIEAELGAALSPNRAHGRPPPVNPSRKGPNASKTDAESILKHIEDALQKDDDRV
jgi:hypothetical protein